ncbi:hypothetical protein [Candidatus Amarolinea aalborgensis]|uniref:CIS tube protein n=1 Tax=Candidatus Amarolinea aalborgensis TaxID=2249329 RepID=UPI003BF97845
MERVAFLVEETNERLRCLLNPETLVLRRTAGVRPRQSTSGQVTGLGLADDPLLYTGGGRTELDLDLLFDVTLPGSSVTSEDVRDLTAPLWRLAENSQATAGASRPPLVRLIWGKSWNIPGIVVAVAERLEHFTAAGVPRRSWLRLRLLRVEAPTVPAATAAPPTNWGLQAANATFATPSAVRVHERLGGSDRSNNTTVEISLAASLVTAGDIIGAALLETPAVALLLAAGRRIVDEAAGAIGKVADWITSAGDSPALAAIRAGLSTMGSAAQRVLTVVSSRVSELQKRVVAEIGAAAARIAATARALSIRLAALTAPAREAIGAALEAALANIRPLARALPQAAAVIAAAVRARAARLLAAALPVLEAGRDAAGRALQRAGSFLSEAAGRAGDAIRTAMETIGQAIQGLRQSGSTSVLPRVQAALAQVAGAVTALWADGSSRARRAARAVEKTVVAMTNGLKNMLEAGEAVALVAGEALRQPITSSATALDAAVAGWTAGNASDAGSAADAGQDLVAAVEALQPAPDDRTSQSLLAPAAQIAAALEQMPHAPPAQVAGQIKPALAALQDALDHLNATEDQAAQALLSAALAAAPGSAATVETPGVAAPDEPPGLLPQPAAATRAIDFGERLDQLSHRYLGDAAFWRALAEFNGIADPLHLGEGLTLRIPSSARGGAR